MNNKTKRPRRRYDRVSLNYISFVDFTPEEYKIWFGQTDDSNLLEEWRKARKCNLGLMLKLNGKKIYDSCDIRELIDIALGRVRWGNDGYCEEPVENRDSGVADYWPFVCFSCGIPECAGFHRPLRVFQRSDDIIFCLRQPPYHALNQKKVKYHAYRLRRRDLLDSLINAIKFRIALEDMILKLTDHRAPEGLDHGDWLTEIFGLHDSRDLQIRISKGIRDDFPRLLDLRMKCN